MQYKELNNYRNEYIIVYVYKYKNIEVGRYIYIYNYNYYHIYYINMGLLQKHF